MRFVLAACAGLCLIAPVAFFACSSAETSAASQDLTADASTSLPNDDEDDTDHEVVETEDPAPAEVVTDGGLEDAAPLDTSVGEECKSDSVREAEPNNDLAAANVLPSKTTTFCGRLLPNDPDFVKFTMPEVVKTFRFEIERGGGMDVQLFIDGKEANFFSPNIPFVPKGQYAIRLSSSQKTDYRILVRINQ